MRRIVGLDRSDPEPHPTRIGQPLRPLTVPNMVGYVRLIGIPIFLYLAFESDDGRSDAAAIIFWLIAAGDYLDGLLARVTGQYSRLGALMDPVVDRLTILSGATVCFYFDLLPRWMLIVLALRELTTVALARWGLRNGLDIEINWFGRAAVFPVMASLFFAMLFGGWFPTTLLAIGLLMGVFATAMYARMGARRARAIRAEAGNSGQP